MYWILNLNFVFDSIIELLYLKAIAWISVSDTNFDCSSFKKTLGKYNL